MRRAIYASLAAAVLAAAGCLELRPGTSGKAPAQNTGSALPVRPAPMVSPDQVNEENAHQKAEALRQEMEQAQRELPAVTLPEVPGTGKPSR